MHLRVGKYLNCIITKYTLLNVSGLESHLQGEQGDLYKIILFLHT